MSTFMYAFAKSMNTADIDSLATNWNRSQTNPLPNSRESDKSEVLKAFGNHAAATIKQLSSATDSALYDRIKSLETELIAAKKSNLANSTKGPDTQHPLGVFAKGDRAAHLEQDCPISKAPKELSTFASKVLKQSDLKNLTKVTGEVKKLLLAINPSDHRMEVARKELINWGMPVAMAASFEMEQAAKLLAIVSQM